MKIPMRNQGYISVPPYLSRKRQPQAEDRTLSNSHAGEISSSSARPIFQLGHFGLRSLEDLLLRWV